MLPGHGPGNGLKVTIQTRLLDTKFDKITLVIGRIIRLMRRLTAISAFALFLAVPLWAQHGGGHAGGGHGGGGFGGGHAGFSGGHSGGFSGGHASGVHVLSGARSSTSRGFTRPPAYSQRSFSRDPYLNRGFRGDRFRGGSRGRFHNYGFRNNCYGYPCGYGYPGNYGYYDPWLWDWWDSGSTYNQDDPSQDVAAAAEMNRQNLEEQRMLRQEEADGDQDLYARSDPAPRSVTREADGAPVLPDTVLVFRDQHKQEVRNYAIVGQTLWNFSQQHTEKIRLSELDLPATAKANDERGLTFRVPASGDAQ